MLVIDALHAADRFATIGAAAEILRKAREDDAPAGVIDIASSVTPSQESSNDAEADRNARKDVISVDLIPGSNRLVTTIMDPVDGAVLLRIPAWLSDAEDLFSASASGTTYL